MKRIHILENKARLLFEVDYEDDINEDDFQAGTDFPRFYDKENDMWWETSWNSDYAFPFGYWSANPYENNHKLYIGDAWTTHANACGKAAKIFVDECIYERYYEYVGEFLDRLEDLVNTIKNGHYTYNDEDESWVSPDGSDEISVEDWIDEVSCDIGINYYIINDYVYKALDTFEVPSAEDMAEEIAEGISKDLGPFYDEQDVNNALQDYSGFNFQNYFEDGYGMGRIWPELGLITFYETEQPEPDVLRRILIDLSNSEEIVDDYDSLLEYFTIFRDFDNDYKVTGCTVQDYMSGNYGPNAEDTERERTYGDGNTQFIPHLASPEEKKRLGVFKDFQKNRDEKWAARLKPFNGNMAAYRAARYPYGEEKKIKGRMLTEGMRNFFLREFMVDYYDNDSSCEAAVELLMDDEFIESQGWERVYCEGIGEGIYSQEESLVVVFDVDDVPSEHSWQEFRYDPSDWEDIENSYKM